MAFNEITEKAEAIKEEANKFFKDGNYDKAIETYTKALELKESAIYYCNRSLAYLRTECFGYALDDASKAVELDSTYVKVIRFLPQDKTARSKFTACQKIYRRRLFEQAISVEEKASWLETFDPASETIEDSYDGPHLEVDDSGKHIVTESFMLALMEHYKSQNKLHKKYAMIMLKDMHTYLHTLLSLVEIDVPELFNGDFVDRGSFSVECIFTLFGFKLLYPKHFYLSRGNHESENMNRLYGFEGEVKSKYSMEMVDIFTDLFNWLPLSHLINERIMVMHGGLFSSDETCLDDVRKIRRDCQPPEGSPMCELLWSDPMESSGRAPSKRGIGCQFGPDVTERFCKANGVDYIIRSHEVKDDGYEVAHNGRCITVFSAPNYCDTMHNRGAFITLTGKRKPDPMQPEFTSFKEVTHPDVRPMAYVNPFLSFFM